MWGKPKQTKFWFTLTETFTESNKAKKCQCFKVKTKHDLCASSELFTPSSIRRFMEIWTLRNKSGWDLFLQYMPGDLQPTSFAPGPGEWRLERLEHLMSISSELPQSDSLDHLSSSPELSEADAPSYLFQTNEQTWIFIPWKISRTAHRSLQWQKRI